MSFEWRGAAVDPGPDEPDPEQWETVTVPGRPAAFAGSDAVAYRTSFSDPRDEDESHVVLALNGLFAHARVWCNGQLLVEHDAYFEPLRLSLPVQDHNEVVVECRAPEDRFGGIHDTDRVPQDRCVPGIWWDATVETHPDPFIESIDVVPRLSDEDGTVELAVTVVTDTALDDRMTVSLRPEGSARGGGMMNRTPIETGPGRVTVTDRVDVRDPSRWWPHDLGGQPRYSLRAKLEDHERTVRTAFRTVEYDEDGLLVNGDRVAARGVNLVDAEPGDVDRAVEANANLVRAHAAVLSPAVYEACDERGVLVWQDLPLTGPGSFDADRGRDLASRVVDARRRHPSLTALSVHDEPVEDFSTGLGSGLLDRYRYRWRAWRATYDREPAESVAAAVDAVPTFPVVGPPGIDPDAATVFPGWSFGEAGDVEWLCDRYGVDPVVGEFGAGALAGEREAEAPDALDDAPDFDVEVHSAQVGTDVETSQTHQAAVVRRVAETLRRRGSNVLAAYALRDVGEAGMGLVSHDGTYKTAFQALASAYEPVVVVLDDPTPGATDVVVVYDRAEPASVVVEWDVDGDRGRKTVDLDAYDRLAVETLSLSAGDHVTLAAAVDDAVTKNEYTI